jgi:hypothetical protein
MRSLTEISTLGGVYACKGRRRQSSVKRLKLNRSVGVAIEIWQQQAFESLGMVFVFNIIDMQVTVISEASQQEVNVFEDNDEGNG